MEAPIVVEGAIDANHTELPAVEATDLHAEEVAARAHDTHAPRRPADGVRDALGDSRERPASGTPSCASGVR